LPRFAKVATNRRSFFYFAAFFVAIQLNSGTLPAQSVCESGNQPISPEQPSGIATDEIIRQFAAKETAFKAARERYGYVLDVTVQTLTAFGRVDGEFHQISEFALDKKGALVERVTFAPESSLRRITLSEDDLDDIRIRLPVAVTIENLPHYSIEYAGRQHVDQLGTYVFKVAPRSAKSEKKLFAGRIWVDDQDLMIVKTCGKPHPDELSRSANKNVANLSPVFVTYREQVGGKFWFSTYAKADEFLAFPKGDVHLREVIRYSDYKPLESK
jgi:hypothetical protein